MSKIVTLTTDFGMKDAFVGVMKGVILGICPEARIVDITHEIPSQNVLEACFIIYSSYSYFPKDAVHVVVVDPGVGSERHIICVETPVGVFIAPDNGVLSLVMSSVVPMKIRSVTNTDLFLHKVSSTFHGRDIFAPVAAHILDGVPVDTVGDPVENPRVIAFPEPMQEGSRLVGEILHIDRFGNLITNILEQDLADLPAESVTVRVGDMMLKGIKRAYADVAVGSPVALLGSSWRLEIAVNRGSAAALLGTSKGEPVEVDLRPARRVAATASRSRTS
jgi:S-adenosylmethionine hydrolase